jgi:hypothetical protein
MWCERWPAKANERGRTWMVKTPTVVSPDSQFDLTVIGLFFTKLHSELASSP